MEEEEEEEGEEEEEEGEEEEEEGEEEGEEEERTYPGFCPPRLLSVEQCLDGANS